jgi:hypothetical protein
MQNCRINNLVSLQLNNKNLIGALELIKPRATTGSLAAYDGFKSEELLQFRRIFCHKLDDIINGSELFPGALLNPIYNQVDLPDDVLETLITYYNEIYGDYGEFISMNDLIERNLQNDSSNRYIVVQPKINQCGRIRIAAEIFGSALSLRYKKNSHILAKFSQGDNSIELFPGQVQYYFEHTLRLPIGAKTHRLAYVKWYLPVDNHQTRFYCRIENDDRSVNIELWKDEQFYELSRDRIIPVHNIYSRFIPAKFIVGKKTEKHIWQ